MNNMNPDQSRPWVLNASIDYLGGLSTNVNLIFKIVGPEGSVAASGNVNNVTTHEGTITGSTFVDPVCVELWWPHGLGMQNLYDLTLDIMVDSHCVATIKRRVGFRTIVLDEGVITQEELDMGIAPGNRWQFKINGHEFFAKGSNFIPVCPSTYREWLYAYSTALARRLLATRDGRKDAVAFPVGHRWQPEHASGLGLGRVFAGFHLQSC